VEGGDTANGKKRGETYCTAAAGGAKVVVSTATKDEAGKKQLRGEGRPTPARRWPWTRRFAIPHGPAAELSLPPWNREAVNGNPTFASGRGALFEEIGPGRRGRRRRRAELTSTSRKHARPWRDLSATADQCIGVKCAHYALLRVRMRREAADADSWSRHPPSLLRRLALRSSSPPAKRERPCCRATTRWCSTESTRSIEEVATDRTSVVRFSPSAEGGRSPWRAGRASS